MPFGIDDPREATVVPVLPAFDVDAVCLEVLQEGVEIEPSAQNARGAGIAATTLRMRRSPRRFARQRRSESNSPLRSTRSHPTTATDQNLCGEVLALVEKNDGAAGLLERWQNAVLQRGNKPRPRCYPGGNISWALE